MKGLLSVVISNFKWRTELGIENNSNKLVSSKFWKTRVFSTELMRRIIRNLQKRLHLFSFRHVSRRMRWRQNDLGLVDVLGYSNNLTEKGIGRKLIDLGWIKPTRNYWTSSIFCPFFFGNSGSNIGLFRFREKGASFYSKETWLG